MKRSEPSRTRLTRPRPLPVVRAIGKEEYRFVGIERNLLQSWNRRDRGTRAGTNNGLNKSKNPAADLDRGAIDKADLYPKDIDSHFRNPLDRIETAQVATQAPHPGHHLGKNDFRITGNANH